MLMDTLLQLNPDADVTVGEDFVVIEIPDQEDPASDEAEPGE